jgi:hypothetical protein
VRYDNVVHYDGNVKLLRHGRDKLSVRGAGGTGVVIDVVHAYVKSRRSSEQQEPE